MNNVPSLNRIVFNERREEIVGYALVQTAGNIEIVVPKGVKKISPLTFIFNQPSKIKITFLGDAPETVEDTDSDWLEGSVAFYNPETIGWENFSWKDKVEMTPIQEN